MWLMRVIPCPHTCRSELQQLVKNISTENNLPFVDGDQLDFSLKLFDLNQVRCHLGQEHVECDMSLMADICITIS